MKNYIPAFTLQPGIIITVWCVSLYQLNHHRDKVIIPMSHSGQNKVTKNLCVSSWNKTSQ
jgi:hypothetical protein